MLQDEPIHGDAPHNDIEAAGHDIDPDRPDTDTLDLIDHMLSVAWFNQYQLGVLISLVGNLQPAAHTVGEVLDQAQQFGTADKSAIGAAATLLSSVRDGDEVAVAECMSRAMGCFDDEELIAGSAALTASLTVTIAHILNIDVLAAQHEMIEAVTGDQPTTPAPTSAEAPLRRVSHAHRVNRRRSGRPLCAATRIAGSLRTS